MGVDFVDGNLRHLCNYGHHLKYTTSSLGYYSGSFRCDICGANQYCSSGRYNCGICKWDVCKFCSNKYKPHSKPILTCRSGHSLLYSRNWIGYTTSKYRCDICSRTYSTISGRWNCNYCKYDVCSFCRPPSATSYSVPYDPYQQSYSYPQPIIQPIVQPITIQPIAVPQPQPYPYPQPQPQPYPVPYPRPYPTPMPRPYPVPMPVPNPMPAPMPGPMPNPMPGPLYPSMGGFPGGMQ